MRNRNILEVIKEKKLVIIVAVVVLGLLILVITFFRPKEESPIVVEPVKEEKTIEELQQEFNAIRGEQELWNPELPVPNEEVERHLRELEVLWQMRELEAQRTE